MAFNKGRSVNFNDTAVVTTVSINSVTATKLVDANPERMFLNIALSNVDVNNISVFIRLFAALTNNNKEGMPIGVFRMGNNNIYKIDWTMPPDNVYTGEVSAITTLGTTTLNITEY